MSIHGIGVDICEIVRIEKLYTKHGQAFIDKLLSDAEKTEFAQKKLSMAFLAKRFAAKEAFSKALGTGVAQGVTLPDIEICHNEQGKPEINLHGNAAGQIEQLGHCCIHLSISDEKGYAVAQVVIELTD